MKKYKKSGSKLLQIRLTEAEAKDVNEFINKFKVTKREFILAVINELREDKIIRENRFWLSNMYFAHANSERYDKQVSDTSKCEECDKKMTRDCYGASELHRHHYKGYEGENAFKVQILCKKCHYKKKGK